MMRTLIFLSLILSFSLASSAQDDHADLPNSENGWYLSPHGTIRVLVIFAEIEYEDRSKDPQPDGAEHWPKGQLPKWAKDVFDPQPLQRPKAMVTRYYKDISLGNYTVLGDYIDRLITIKESDHRGIASAGTMSKAAVAEANKLGYFKTAHGSKVADLDLWKDGGKPGMPKEQGADDPHSFDHVMVILRNSGLRHGQGSTDAGSPGELLGYKADTQSRFGAMNGLPFEILKHEFNHLLLGGNNFHTGGGNAANFESHFIPVQGGYSMMGAASSSLLTANGWDRDRLGWYPPRAQHRVNARDMTGALISGDLDPLTGDTGIFILKDFVTTGDAIRIKLPFIPEDRFQQWLWLENHQTERNNSSPTDRFHYEEFECTKKAPAGIYAYMQVGRDEKVGKDIYGGYSDHIRQIPANGLWDYELHSEEMDHHCIGYGKGQPFMRNAGMSNPLSGNNDLELIVYDRDNDGSLSKREHYVPGQEWRNGRMIDEAIFFGHPRQVFTVSGTSEFGMGTNPSTSNMLTLVVGQRDRFKEGAPNNRTVYLNGISVRLVQMASDGAITLHIRANDTYINEDLRWCADSLVLPALDGYEGHALHLARGRSIVVDRSLTPTRIDGPQDMNGRRYFSKPTRMTVSQDAHVFLEEGSSIELRNGSEMHILPGATLELGPKSSFTIGAECRLVLHDGAKVITHEKAAFHCTGPAAIVDQGVTVSQVCDGKEKVASDKACLTCKTKARFKRKSVNKP